MSPKFKLGDVVKIWDEKYQCFIDGHIVLIMNAFSDDRDYYCSIYPGAISNYEYIYCVDPLYPDVEISLQTLNKFKENQIKLADIKIERQRKLKEIHNE